jgi:Arc/MetJ-type ribon-helix-helix transcriptional regulator
MKATPVAPVAFRRPTRYDTGMTKVAKITISLPQEQAEQARAAVERGEAPNVSRYISGALAAAAPGAGSEKKDTLADLVADIIAEDGAPSPEAYAWADRVLGLTGTEG